MRALPAIASSKAPTPVGAIPEASFANRPPYEGEPEPFDASSSVVVSRDEQSTTWRDDKGVLWKRVYSGQVNFQDASGKWGPIDTSIIADAGGGFRNAAGPAKFQFDDKTDGSDTVQISKDDWSLGFTLSGAADKRTAQPSGSTVDYTDVAPNMDLEYRVEPSALKEYAILKAPPGGDAPLRLSFPLHLEHESGIDTIEMGARQYAPGLGRFIEVDPVEGGSASDYDYVSHDPENAFDLAGQWCTLGYRHRSYYSHHRWHRRRAGCRGGGQWRRFDFSLAIGLWNVGYYGDGDGWYSGAGVGWFGPSMFYRHAGKPSHRIGWSELCGCQYWAQMSLCTLCDGRRALHDFAIQKPVGVADLVSVGYCPRSALTHR